MLGAADATGATRVGRGVTVGSSSAISVTAALACRDGGAAVSAGSMADASHPATPMSAITARAATQRTFLFLKKHTSSSDNPTPDRTAFIIPCAPVYARGTPAARNDGSSRHRQNIENRGRSAYRAAGENPWRELYENKKNQPVCSVRSCTAHVLAVDRRLRERHRHADVPGMC